MMFPFASLKMILPYIELFKDKSNIKQVEFIFNLMIKFMYINVFLAKIPAI